MVDGYILLVEDDANDEELTLMAFKKANIGIKIVVTRDGAEALDFLFSTGKYANKENNEMPHVILLDLNLPKVGGLEVLRQIRSDERTKSIPVVILTSSKQDRDVLEGYNFGANSYVVKPVDFPQFLKAIQELGLYWLYRNQAMPKVRSSVKNIKP